MNSSSSIYSVKLLVLVFLISVLPAKLVSQESIKISRFSAEVNFDGIPDEAVWKEATVFPMVVHYPSYGAEPSEISEVLMGYDQEYLYVAGRLYSKDPHNITASSFGLSF